MLNSRDISLLRPDVAANCRVWLELCRAAGLSVLVTGTVRDDEYQMYCYRNGTSKATRPAFHARGVGLAFDFCKNVKGHEYDDAAFFREAAEIAEEMGFEWGGRWKSFPDKPHLQWSAGGRYKSSDLWAGRMPPAMPLYQKEDDEMTQEQFNAMMDKYIEQVSQQEPSAWSREAREWAEGRGIINGDETGRKKYKKPCTREELVQILYNQSGEG